MPKRVDKEAKRQGILRAAMEVFAEKGMANTKIADISERAGIGKGTLYEYYTNKEEIFREAMVWFMTSIKNEVTEQMSLVSDPRAKLRSLVWGMIDGASALGEYIKIMLDFWSVGMRTQEVEPWREIYQWYIMMVIEIIEEGISTKIFRKVDSRSLASALVGLFDGFIFQIILFGNEYPIRKTVDAFIDILFNGIELERSG